MKIATWNVNSIRARLEHFDKWLTQTRPDIVLLQELKCLEHHFPHEMAEDHGYNVAIHGQKSYNGVAILSKFPLEDVTSDFHGNPDLTHARYIEAVTAGLRVASVYVPNGQEIGSDKFAYKLAFLNALKDYFCWRLKLDEKFIIGGDFNVAPYPQDMHNPLLSGTDRILCSLPEQQAFRSLLSIGLHDAIGALYSPPPFSWWDYRQGAFAENRGYRIDHLLLSSSAFDRLKEGGVDLEPRAWPRPSDHSPVWITLQS